MTIGNPADRIPHSGAVRGRVVRVMGLLLLLPSFMLAQDTPQIPAVPVTGAGTSRDGQHDFDFEVGSWKIHLKRRLRPLSGSDDWTELEGSSVTRKVWGGRANIEELNINGPSGHLEGLTLRLYNPETRQWSLYWANSKAGALGGPPNVGEFQNGRGEFYCQDTLNGRVILIRYIWSGITPNAAHFEESFSDDGGRSWEVNWITDQVRQ